MGYTTDFWGELALSKPLSKRRFDYINSLSSTRRMKRDVNKLMELYQGKHGHPNPKDKTPEGIYGNEGEYFILEDGNSGQNEDASILDYNTPPGQNEMTRNVNFETWKKENNRRLNEGICQPGLWCQWVLEETEDESQVLQWDGGEKFYNYIEWLKYLINHFFEPWGVKLNGVINWAGEERDDMGIIVVENNKVKIKVAEVTFKDVDEE